MVLTAADLGDDPLSQGDVLSQLLPETLTHVVVDVVGTEQLLKGLGGCFLKKKKPYKHKNDVNNKRLCLPDLGGVPHVLGEDVADPLALPHPLPQVGQLAGLGLDQGVVLPVARGRGR